MIIAIIIICILILYTCLIYPLFLYLYSRFKYKGPVSKFAYQPNISIIVPVFNAGPILEKKINNLFSLKYPKDKIEIIFISDGSTDDTLHELSSFDFIKVLTTKNRVGKECALRKAVNQAK